ncbi:KipI family sensor histidine kinase inhibitor [Prauserella sediminis]|uniref:KipI family sensor histidine kinase inhibitor n=1 Tax=Prauserella sediminis TaxID=577680 RepID=A0A839XR82_9PSEU|nr:carboxyltransferase domain-containing protein [Prauserella sediminis]MBB3666312.1 KipI family sensor histidine kinase inhibitor [Prauserella sediminis]
MTSTSNLKQLRIVDCGDAAVSVQALDHGRERSWQRIRDLTDALAPAVTEGAIASTIATYDAVLVEFDSAVTSHEQVRAMIKIAAACPANRPHHGRTFDIPVVYGGEYGPDLDKVAAAQDLDIDAVIAAHTDHPLTMRCYGSPGGAPMLDGPDLPRPVPRLASPRPHVPAGAVALAGRQAVVSARPAPGGWCVIGQTPRILVDPTHSPVSAFAPGDAFRFHAIDPHEWTTYERHLHA